MPTFTKLRNSRIHSGRYMMVTGRGRETVRAGHCDYIQGLLNYSS